jgi:hypothetical protein
LCLYECLYVCMKCMNVCMFVWMDGCKFGCLYACMYVCVYSCLGVWMMDVYLVCVFMYVCIYVYMYVCVYEIYVCMYESTLSTILLKLRCISFVNICVVLILNCTMRLTGLHLIHIAAAAVFQRATAMSTEQTLHW